MAGQSLIGTFASHAFLSGLSEKHLMKLASGVRPFTARAGEFIAQEGERALGLYLIQSGHAKIGTRPAGDEFTSIADVGPGEVVGWSWLLPPHRWQFDCRASDQVQGVMFDAEWLREQCENDHELGYHLLKHLLAVLARRLAASRRTASPIERREKEADVLSMQIILHATDFSDRSAYAFQLACSLAREHGARLVVLHVVPPPTALGYEGLPVTPAFAPLLTSEYRQEMEAKLRAFHPAEGDLPTEYRLEQGFATDEILRTAREAKADLIVLGTHGRSGLGRLLLGSVAEQVVRKAACPVLAVKGAQSDIKGAIRNILHPTDFSKRSRHAFRLACWLASDQGARLTCLHVRTPPHATLYGGEPVIKQLEEHDRQEEEELHRLVPRHCEIPIAYRMEQGAPAEEIVRVARETGCDLIVMGTHGRTGLGRVLMGSVAEQVLREVPCPVLLVKSPNRNAEATTEAVMREPAQAR